jgi:two-component system alkaline phosphatase synthesis response regulator PhoP
MKMQNAGYEVITAVNGLNGLEMFIKEKPQIIITDINMPLLDGQELCRMIDERKEKYPFFIIVMTSSVESDLRSWSMGDEKIHFVEKPFSPRKILNLVNKLISKLREENVKV